MSTAGSLSLNGTWDVAWSDDFPTFLTSERLPGRHTFKAAVPSPIHQALLDAGYLDDPRVGMNALRARWVEEMYWSYRRPFATPEGLDAGIPAWLVFDRLEMNAVVYLNGAEVGRHANAHRPARFEVTGRLRADAENLLVVLLEAGLFDCADKPGGEYSASPLAKLTKIHWQRRGQWQRGWDWQQRLLNVGILGDVRLEWSDTPIVEQVQIYAEAAEDLRQATLHAWFTLINPEERPTKGTLYLHTAESAEAAEFGAELPVLLPPGMSRHEVTFAIEQPRLWWPAGHGEPYCYGVVAAFIPEGESERTAAVARRVGIRKVEVDQSPHPEEGRYFTLKINGKPIFCKGGNWVPPDMLYSTVTPERYRELVDLALGANFNLLRIWGGGVFADPALLDYCDEKGVLVWHDLLFACSKYPGDHPEFAAEVRREVTWAVREMAHHPSLVVWCGNNEIEEGDWHWGYDSAYRTHPHYALFHHDLPQIVTREDPSKFYWISSPYSPDYKSPRDPTVGDQHPWRVSLQMDGGADWWEYRRFVDRFPNEGGVLGCSSPATLRQFLPEKEQHLLSPSWEFHDNPFAMNDVRPGRLGHAYQTVQLWLGRDPFEMTLDDYAFASALLQAEGLSEYIANYRRRMFSSSAAIFWMYNDSWPVAHGWTIVDYYRRRKLAYHPVRRAFAPVTVVIVGNGGDRDYHIYGINETAEPWQGRVQWGLLAADSISEFEGQYIPVVLPPNAVQEIVVRLPVETELANRFHSSKAKRFSGNQQHPYVGAFAVLYANDGWQVAQHRTFWSRFYKIGLMGNTNIALTQEDGFLTLLSDVLVWGVCLDLDGEKPVPDNCFDLLPGIPYRLPWDENVLGEPRVLRTGNEFR